MTREEAIKFYADEILLLELAPTINGDNGSCMKEEWKRQAEIHRMAISALKEQESGSCKKCTDHTDGCEYCRESENIYYHAGAVNALDEILYITGDDLVVDIGCRFYLATSIKFCPMCGRRLEEV